MSVIEVKCVDQVLSFENMPVISSGNENVDKIKFDFDSSWDGFAKTCIFYKNKDMHYGLVNGDNEVLIPKEVLSSDGKIHFGVMGIKENKTITSTIVSYNIKEGAVNVVDDPTGGIYSQVMAKLAEFTAFVNEITQNKALYLYESESETEEIEPLQSQIDDLKETVNALSGAVDALSALSGTVNSLSGTVSSLSGTVSSLSGTVSSLSGTVDELTRDVIRISGTVSTLQEQVNNSSGELSAQSKVIQQIQQRIGELQSLIEDVASGIH